MRAFLSLVILLLISFQSITAQSFTKELAPSFYEQNEHILSDEIYLETSFDSLDFIGISFYYNQGEDITLHYRYKHGNIWSEWKAFKDQHEFVIESRRAYAAEPIRSSFEKLQFKSTLPINSRFKFRLFYAYSKDVEKIAVNRSFNCSLPEFCDRTCWCSNCPIDATPQFTEPTHLIVHHSAGFNESNNFASVVEYYYDLHVNTNGWDDIGYNWLIDPNGTIYQGRLDNFQGAHFSCINENTVGICVIGDYSTVSPSEEAINSLVELLGYEATEHTIDVLDESYHETGDFIIQNISGHRDGNDSANGCSSTVCPGNSFYPMLQDIRIQISELDCYQDAISVSGDLKEQTLKIYPSPFTNQLFIDSDENRSIEFQLVDLLGNTHKIMYSNHLNDTNNLAPGIYYIIQDGRAIKKVVKK